MDDSPLISIPIRDFAIAVPRTGSIDSYSGYGRQQEGLEIHLAVQSKRSEEYQESYRAEVAISREFQRDGLRFKVGGRIDGIFDGKHPKIEEIKSTFNIRELGDRLREQTETHPYCLQLKTYGYFYYLEHGVLPDLSFHLVSTRSGDTDDLTISLDRSRYEEWLNLRLDQLVQEVQRSKQVAERRNQAAKNFRFPFEHPRPGQLDLIQKIEDSFSKKKRLMVQAPTGLGKTVGVLFPALKDALSRSQQVIYVTPKNSQHMVAEEAIERFQAQGAEIRGLTITAKSKICMKAEPLCNPEYCEYAREHYTKISESNLLEKLSKTKNLGQSHFRTLAEDHEVCPYELQLEATREADVIVCDYNYVFSPRGALARLDDQSHWRDGAPNLVIDEAHNLPSRAMDYFSPALSSGALEKMRPEVQALPATLRIEAEDLLDECIDTIIGCNPFNKEVEESRSVALNRGSRIDPPSERFLTVDQKLRGFLIRYLESDIEIKPRDVILRLCFYWSEFADALSYIGKPDHTEFFTTYQTHKHSRDLGHTSNGGTVKITCCDASKFIESCYKQFENVVAFSATLKPFDYYAALSGLDSAETLKEEFKSPFPSANRKVLVIPQVSTKYSDRDRNYPRIAEAIHRIASLRAGNYFAFFPSFEFLDRVLERFNDLPGFVIMRQEREMRAVEIDEIVEHLRSQRQPTIVFAVQGGVLSEGLDYPGDAIIGAFIIGPPLPSYDLERETMREFYSTRYGKGKSFDYAYTFPAMAKAIQAAGRVIRSETDRGIIVLMDSRFLQPNYSQSMPSDWFDAGPGELVSHSILADIREFWAQSPYTQD